jgi:hypothetical protein
MEPLTKEDAQNFLKMLTQYSDDLMNLEWTLSDLDRKGILTEIVETSVCSLQDDLHELADAIAEPHALAYRWPPDGTLTVG